MLASSEHISTANEGDVIYSLNGKKLVFKAICNIVSVDQSVIIVHVIE